MKLSDMKFSSRIGIIDAICISGMLNLVAIFAVNQRIRAGYAGAIEIAQNTAHKFGTHSRISIPRKEIFPCA
ncbi:MULTISPECIES: hypothetical protein [unclassified Aurantimonas]|uniref:hypothetical protein n=1 Tax=unclassified Aurantimonas TaxID=2638230 RepID=UPI002E19DEA7|nr:hypothetical protein [Aurantimonas sp. A3-2-R12]